MQTKTNKPQIKVVAERTITIKAGHEKLREAIKNELARKGSRAGILIRRLHSDPEVIWKPADLDAAASELRHLAFQIRALQQAKVATEEA